MIRRLVTIGILVVIGAGAGITYVLLKNRPPEEYVRDSSYDKVRIVEYDRDKIQKIELNSPNGKLTLVREMGEWKADYPYSIRLDEMDVEDVAATFSALWAEDLVEENPEDLSQYGLDEPTATGTAYLEDGSTVVLYLGDRTPVGNTYYLMAEGDPNVYTVWMSSGNYLQYVVSDIRDTKLPELDSMSMTYVKIVRNGVTQFELVDDENRRPEDEIYLFTSGSWAMTQPYPQIMAVDLGELETFFKSIGAFEIKEFVDDDSADLSKYGLDPPQAEVILRDVENELHFLLGSQVGDYDIYVKIPGRHSVAKMDKSLFDFVHTPVFPLVDGFLFITLIDEVNRIVVETGGEKHVAALRRTEETVDGETETVTSFYVDDREADEDAFRAFYRSMVGIMIDAEVEGDVNAAPEIKTSFYLTPRGTDTEVRVDIDFTPYDRSFYAATRDGLTEFVVSRLEVDRMLEDLRNLAE